MRGVRASVVTAIGIARGGGAEGPRPPANEKRYRVSLVNLTPNMRYKNDKNIKLVITRFVFFKLEMHQNPFSAGADPLGELTTLPQIP